jgi:glycosyltransferase involved in cell wall biosynthesis
MRVAIVHYWFLNYGGGEKVVEALADIFPDADYYVLFADPKSIPRNITPARVKASFLNQFSLAKRLNRAFFPLYPLAVESFDLRDYDLVISSDSPPMKGLMLQQSTTHICYCHTPGRYLWDNFSEYRSTLPSILRPFYTAATQYVRSWDFQAAQRVDEFVANSKYVAERIWKYYRRPSTVIYPPVSTADAYIVDHQDDYYLSVGRLVENKRLDLLIHACNRLGRRLLIAGTGRTEKKLKSIAGPTIEFLGRVPEAELPELYARCRALLFSANEDFGIVPLEAQAYGRPVIALRKGGSIETVLGYSEHTDPTGLFFPKQDVDSLVDAMIEFENVEHSFTPRSIRKHACTFDKTIFESKIRSLLREKVPGAIQEDTEVPRNEMGFIQVEPRKLQVNVAAG